MIVVTYLVLLCDLTFRSNKLSFVLKIGNKSQILSQYVMFDWRLEDVSLRWIRLESCWMLRTEEGGPGHRGWSHTQERATSWLWDSVFIMTCDNNPENNDDTAADSQLQVIKTENFLNEKKINNFTF